MTEVYIDGLTCPECGRVFRGNDPDRLALHVRVAHPADACTYCGSIEPGPMHGVLGHVPSMQHAHVGPPGHVHTRTSTIRVTSGPNYGPAVATPGAPARIGSWLDGSADVHVHPESRRTGR